MKKILIFLTTAVIAVVGMLVTTKTAKAIDIDYVGFVTITMDRGGVDSLQIRTEEQSWQYAEFLTEYGPDYNRYNTEEYGVEFETVLVNDKYYEYVFILANDKIGNGDLYEAYIYLYLGGERVETIQVVPYIEANNYNGIYIEDGKQRPGISGEDSLLNNIDNPYSLDDIKRIANIKVHDAYYGDLTDLLEIKEENYSENMSKVGTFTITYQVTNDFGLTSEYVLTIFNRDITAPVIEGPESKTISYKEPFDPQDLSELFTITDNYDTDLLLFIDDERYDYVPDKVGTFTFEVYTRDKSQNLTFKTFLLHVIDDVPPVITSEQEGIIQMNYKDSFTDSKLLLGLTLEDEIDGVILNKINIVDRGGIKNKVGTYTVKYEGSDKAGNVAYFERVYEVITSDAPEFFVSRNLINIEDVNKLTSDQIADIIASYEKIDYASFKIITDEYTGNESVAGNYSVSIEFTDKQGNITLHERVMSVFSGEELNTEVDGFFYKIKNFFKNVWKVLKSIGNTIWKVVKWPFKQVAKLLNIGKTNSVVFLLNRY